MEVYFIVMFILLIGGYLLEMKKQRKQFDLPYFKIKKQLEKELSMARFSDDWKHRQELQLQLVWLDVFKLVFNSIPQSDNKVEKEKSYLGSLSYEEIKFPILNLDGTILEHFFFCFTVVQNVLKEIQNGNTLICSQKEFFYPKNAIIEIINFFKGIMDYYTDSPIDVEYYKNLPESVKNNLVETVKLIDWQLQVDITDEISKKLGDSRKKKQ